MIKAILLLAGCALVAQAADPNCAGYNGTADTICEQWNNLRYLWSPGTVTGATDNSIPLDGASTAGSSGTLLSPSCVNTDAVSGATWYGYRFAVSESQLVIALYDSQGSIAGIQLRINSDSVNPAAGFRHDLVPMFQNETIANGTVYYVLTAYTVDPSTICTQGRPASAISNGNNNAVGDRLYFQNGPTPSSLLWAPRIRSDALKQGYSDNNCFLTMGSHTFFGVEQMQATSCTTIVPVFLLYNCQGYLIGFGFDWVGKNWDSDSFESPPANVIQTIVGDNTPQCLIDLANNKDIQVSTMHVFFVNRNPNPMGTVAHPLTCNCPATSG